VSYYVNANQRMSPIGAMTEVGLVVSDVARVHVVRAVLTSSERDPRSSGDKSLHRFDLARDFDFWRVDGTARLSAHDWVTVYKAIRERLPAQFYDVVDEGDHIHIEFDPKFVG